MISIIRKTVEIETSTGKSRGIKICFTVGGVACHYCKTHQLYAEVNFGSFPCGDCGRYCDLPDRYEYEEIENTYGTNGMEFYSY